MIAAIILIATTLFGVNYFDGAARRFADGAWREISVWCAVANLYVLCATVLYLAIFAASTLR